MRYYRRRVLSVVKAELPGNSDPNNYYCELETDMATSIRGWPQPLSGSCWQRSRADGRTQTQQLGKAFGASQPATKMRGCRLVACADERARGTPAGIGSRSKRSGAHRGRRREPSAELGPRTKGRGAQTLGRTLVGCIFFYCFSPKGGVGYFWKGDFLIRGCPDPAKRRVSGHS